MNWRALPLLLLAVRLLPAPERDVGDFFERFTAEWVRADPQLATENQYFSGAEQDRLDGQLTPQTAQFRKERVDRARRGLGELRRFDRKRLSGPQRVSARVLDWQLEAIVQGARYEAHGYVFHQMGMPGLLVRYLTDIHPARTPRDVENYLARLSQVATRADEMIVEARARALRGIVPPRFILTATIDQIERIAAPEPGNNILVESYGQRIAKVSSISEDNRRKFHAAATKVVADSVVPALRRVIALLEEQRKTATDDAGFSRLPEGADAYAWRLHVSTSTALTPDQVHRTGLEQVATIEGHMDTLLRQLGYNEGPVKDRFQKAEDDHSYPEGPDIRASILVDYEKIIRDAEQRAGALFDLRPRAPVVVRRIPEYAERNAAANYSAPARDGSKPGVFNVPLVGPKFSLSVAKTRSACRFSVARKEVTMLQARENLPAEFWRPTPVIRVFLVTCGHDRILGSDTLLASDRIRRLPVRTIPDQNTSWHTTLRTPDTNISSHLPELTQNRLAANARAPLRDRAGVHSGLTESFHNPPRDLIAARFVSRRCRRT